LKSPQNQKKPYIPKPYHTPEKIGVKWQLDVKYVPKHCYHGSLSDSFYQYTIIDKCTLFSPEHSQACSISLSVAFSLASLRLFFIVSSIIKIRMD